MVVGGIIFFILIKKYIIKGGHKYIMNLQDLITALIASSPQLVIVLTTLKSLKKNAKNSINEFPSKLNSLKGEVVDDFNLLKNNLSNGFNDFKKETTKIIEDKVQEVISKTVDVMGGMKKELGNYAEKMNTLMIQNSQLIKENKTFQNVIGVLVGNNPQKIKDGVATLVARELNISKQELQQLPSDIVNSLPQIKNDLVGALRVLSKDQFENLLKEVGYERKEEKL